MIIIFRDTVLLIRLHYSRWETRNEQGLQDRNFPCNYPAASPLRKHTPKGVHKWAEEAGETPYNFLALGKL